MSFRNFIRRLAIVPKNVSHGEKLITACGCFFCILTITWLSETFVSGYGLPVLVASMGASTILVFAVPHGPFSQPWSVIGGQVTSALTGISCLLLIPNQILAGAMAVCMAAYLMYLLRCLHPPGGATALVAVLGGTEMNNLGYQFAFTPVGLDSLVLVLMGLILNNLLPGRSYPAHKPETDVAPINPKSSCPVITPEDLEAALIKMDTYIDVAREDLLKIYMYAHQHARSTQPSNFEITAGRCYSNGEYDANWSVRQVMNTEMDKITYRVITSQDSEKTIICTRKEMSQWAKYEVFRK